MISPVIPAIAFVLTKLAIHSNVYRSAKSPPPLVLDSLPVLKALDLTVTVAGVAAFFVLLTVHNALALTVIALAAAAGDLAIRFVCYFYAVKRSCGPTGRAKSCANRYRLAECIGCVLANRCEPARRTRRRSGQDLLRPPALFKR